MASDWLSPVASSVCNACSASSSSLTEIALAMIELYHTLSYEHSIEVTGQRLTDDTTPSSATGAVPPELERADIINLRATDWLPR